MHGFGVGSGFSGNGESQAPTSRSLVRAQINGLVSVTDKLELFNVDAHQLERNDDKSTHWSTLGIRPQYNFNEFFNLQLELGVDHVLKDGEQNVLSKGTLALAYSFGESGFLGRPQAHAFVTHGMWTRPEAVGNHDFSVTKLQELLLESSLSFGTD